MRLAIISDTHFGNPKSALVRRDKSGKIRTGPQYQTFAASIKQNLGELDYLVLAGDILDFAIASYHEAFKVGQSFFNQIKQDGITKEIIYIPGNHDFDIWHTVEYQVNVIDKFEKGKLPTKFRMSVPGIIDDRKDTLFPGLTLFGVSAKQEPDQPKYAGLFLDRITDPPTPFNFVYPNLYIVTDNETILITHGQYLDQFWSFLGQWARKLAADDLKLQAMLDMNEVVGLNFPLSQLSSSGIGQAGKLTEVILALEHEIEAGKFERLEKYLDRMDREVDQLLLQKWYTSWLEPGEEIIYQVFKKILLKSLSNIKKTRYADNFIREPEVRKRFLDYYAACLREVDQIKTHYGLEIPTPKKLIFGHTHQPIPWKSRKASRIKPARDSGTKSVVFYNTGGWLSETNEQGEPVFCGAEIFMYETGKGFSSVTVK